MPISLEFVAPGAASGVDLRKRPLVTMDCEDAKDFDDAVYGEPNRGGFRLLVAIADVSHYVRPETPLDDEAQKLATSVYFPGFVVPMLPVTLSNCICSLNPKFDPLSFLCYFQVHPTVPLTNSPFLLPVFCISSFLYCFFHFFFFSFFSVSFIYLF